MRRSSAVDTGLVRCICAPVTGRSSPLIEIARADRDDEAIGAAEAWKVRHPKAAEHLEPADVLIDRMRSSSSLRYRVRINLAHVPAKLRPKEPRSSKPSTRSKPAKSSNTSNQA